MIKGSCLQSMKVLLKNIDKRYDNIESRETPRDSDDWWEYVNAYRDLVQRIQNELRIVVD